MVRKPWFWPALSVIAGLITVICLVKFYMPWVIYSDVPVDGVVDLHNNHNYEVFMKALPVLAEQDHFEVICAFPLQEELPHSLYLGLKVPYNYNSMPPFEPYLLILNRLKFVNIFTVLGLSLMFGVALPLAWLLDGLEKRLPAH